MPGLRTFLCLAVVLLVSGCNAQPPANQPTAPTNSAEIPPRGQQIVGEKPPMPAHINRPTLNDYRVEDYATGLQIVWDIVFAPGGRVYVTERPGRVRLIENGQLRVQPYAVLRNVHVQGEGGLMGMALHPDYPNPRWVYLMYTYRAEGRTYNRVSRFTDTGNGLTDERPVVVRIPGAAIHNGGTIRFGPDGLLYVGTGDAGDAELAQDRNSLAGKILRVTAEGQIPEGNPFNSPVYAYGLRNVQGLAWNPDNGDLWATMHGPTARDSIFIVERGGNHGWPGALGVTGRQGVVPPILFYPEPSVPPAQAIFYTGDLMPELRGNFFFASLRGEHLQRVVLDGPRRVTRLERWWQTGTHRGQYGRLRAVVQGPDGAIYVGTSNRDGRGRVRSGDDRILRISPR